MCTRNLVRALSADLDGFLRGLALWLNEGIETGRWGNGAEEDPHPPDSENLLLSEIMKDDSNRGRVELKGSTRQAHLDVNGMDIDVEPEDSATNGELHEARLTIKLDRLMIISNQAFSAGFCMYH